VCFLREVVLTNLQRTLQADNKCIILFAYKWTLQHYTLRRVIPTNIWQGKASFNTNCRYRQFELLISPLVIADINNSNYWYQQFALVLSVMNMICWYRQIELLISTIGIIAIDAFVISTIGIVDIKYVHTLLISTIGIADITNAHCRYQQLELLISIIHISDIGNWY